MENNHKSLLIIFIATFAGIVIFTALSFYLKYQLNFPDVLSKKSIVNTIIPAIELILIVLGYFLYDQDSKKSKSSAQMSQQERFNIYKIATFKKLIAFELAGFANAVMIIVNFQKNYLYMATIIAVLFVLNIPSQSRFNRDFVPNEANSYKN